MPRFSDNVHDLASQAQPVCTIPVTREDLTDTDGNTSGTTIDCNDPANKNNPLCNIGDDMMWIVIIVSIVVIIVYGIMIYAIVKTKSDGLKIFLVICMFLPPLSLVGFIVALLVIFGAIQ